MIQDMTRASAGALLTLGLLAALPARAEVPLNEQGTVLFFGDLRVRGEMDWDSRNSDGSERDDRDRVRLRLRAGFRFAANEHFSMAVRGRSGNTNSQQSPHVTIWQDGDKGDADALIDRAWLKGTWSHGHVWGGRNGHPFWRQDEFLFDDDIFLDGLGFQADLKSGDTRHEFRGAWAAVPEGEAGLAWDESGWLYGLQYALHHDRGDGRGVSAALLGVRVEDDDAVANPVLLDLDWTVWGLQLQGRLRAGELPVTLGADWFHGSDAPPAGTWNRDQRDGLVLFVKVGSLKAKGEWLAGASYAHVEQFAVIPFLAQDDWLRWGSATQTRSSNYEGFELRFGYAIAKDMNILARLYVVDAIDLRSATATHREDGKRFRLDFNWKF